MEQEGLIEHWRRSRAIREREGGERMERKEESYKSISVWRQDERGGRRYNIRRKEEEEAVEEKRRQENCRK